MCIELDCEHYTPCKKCGKNVALDTKKHCRSCGLGKDDSSGNTVFRTDTGFTTVSNNDVSKKPRGSGNARSNVDSIADSVLHELNSEVSSDGIIPDIEFSVPGTSPTGLSDSEGKYYMKQWKRYSEYYSDPTLETTLHTIIVVELELLWITARVAASRGEYEADLMARRSKLTGDIGSLRKSLPEEEAGQISEREASLSFAYDQYVKERGKTSLGGVDRVFSRDAVALNGALPFKTNLSYILEKLGYNSVDATEAISKVNDIEGMTAIEVAELFGFHITKEFAMEEGIEGVMFNVDDEPDMDDYKPDENVDSSLNSVNGGSTESTAVDGAV